MDSWLSKTFDHVIEEEDLVKFEYKSCVSGNHSYTCMKSSIISVGIVNRFSFLLTMVSVVLVVLAIFSDSKSEDIAFLVLTILSNTYLYFTPKIVINTKNPLVSFSKNSSSNSEIPEIKNIIFGVKHLPTNYQSESNLRESLV
jgi:hypothetical protein